MSDEQQQAGGISRAESLFSDRLWDIFVKALPVLIAALVGAHIQGAVHDAEQDMKLAACQERTAAIEKIQVQQAVTQERVKAIAEDTAEIRRAILRR